MNKLEKDLKKLKEEAYSRPEKYPFERFDKLMAWALVATKGKK